MNNKIIRDSYFQSIRDHQRISFDQQSSLNGWSSNNYPRVLNNPLLKIKQVTLNQEQIDQRLGCLYQNNIDKENAFLKKPFSDLNDDGKSIEKIKDMISSRKKICSNSYEQNFNIIQKTSELYKNSELFNPQTCLIVNQKDRYSIQKRPIGYQQLNLSHEDSDINHYKQQPPNCATENNIIKILNQELLSLDVSSNISLSNDLINKIGYLAPNLEQLNMSQTYVTDEALFELSQFCLKLQSINISKCVKLTSQGITKFLSVANKIEKLYIQNNASIVKDETLNCLQENKHLRVLNVSLNNQLTDHFILNLNQCKNQFNEIYLVSLNFITEETLANFIHQNSGSLQSIDISLMNQKNITNNLLKTVATCRNLQNLNMNGCTQFSDNGIRNLTNSELVKLKYLRIGNITDISEDQIQRLFRAANKISLLDLTGNCNVSDNFMQSLLNEYKELETIILNNTPQISNQMIKECKKKYPNVRIVKFEIQGSVNDNGLRMPLINEKVINQRYKKSGNSKKK